MTETERKAQQYLLASQNSDGGWPFISGKASAVEPTCYAILALNSPARERGVEWLKNLPGSRCQWTRALSLLTLARVNQLKDMRAALVRSLLEVKVRTIEDPGVTRLDGKLRGWAWFDHTFSWVEPTGYAILALKAAGQGNHPRVAEGERLLLDRVCSDGGWNYGNTEVRGIRLPPMLQPTAVAAMALQDAPAARDTVLRATDLLDREVRSRSSALSLAMTVLCFNVFGRQAGDFIELLVKRQLGDGSWRGQANLTALALLAIKAASGGKNAFKLG